MDILKLVVTGPVGAGKSTFIRSVSEMDVVDTDRSTVDAVGVGKGTTTVAMDFGCLSIGPDRALHLYGTPGQLRFDFMWDVLIQRAHAYILLVAANQPGEFRHARLIHRFMQERSALPMIVGVTHRDCGEAWDPGNIAIALGFTTPQKHPPLVSLNANDPPAVTQAIMTLLECCLSS